MQSISSHQIGLSIAEQDPQRVQLAMTGRVSERVAEGSTNDFAVETTVVGKASFDPSIGAVTEAWTETLTASTMGPFAEGDDPRPAAMPEPKL